MTPRGWRVLQVGDFATRSKVVNLAGQELPPLSITKGQGVILQSDKYNKRIATDLRKYVVARRGQFAFDPMSLYYGSIGEVACVDRGLVSPDYVVFDVTAGVNGTFLNYLLRSPAQIAQYESVAEAGNQFGKRRRVYWSVFKQLPLALPPLPEQRTIASILSSVDRVIEMTQAVMDQLHAVKTGLVRELLTRGLPGRPKKLKKTELGELPEHWEVVSCGEVVESFVDFRGRTPKKLGMAWGGGQIPALSAMNVQMGRVNLARPTNFASERLYRAWMTSGDPAKGDVLLTTEAPLGNVAQVPDGQKYILSQRVILMRPLRTVMDPDFLAHLMRSNAFQRALRRDATGTTAMGIQRARLVKIRVAVPPLDEQRSIATMLGALMQRLDHEERTLAAGRTVKSALMSVLLTGDVRARRDPEVGA